MAPEPAYLRFANGFVSVREKCDAELGGFDLGPCKGAEMKQLTVEALEFRNMMSAVQLTDFPLPDASHYKSLVTLGDFHYFAAPAAEGTINESGQRQFGLYRTDGTVTGTELVRDGFWGNHADDAIGNVWTVSPGLQVDAVPRIVFAADDGVHGDEPWVTDGTTVGTMLLRDDPEPVCCPTSAVAETYDSNWFNAFSPVVSMTDGALLYWSHRTSKSILWRTDGTQAGTSQVVTINSPNSGERDSFAEYDGAYYFVITTVTRGNIHIAGAIGESKLWRTDGTAAGTQEIAPVAFPAMTPQVVGNHIYTSPRPQAGAGLRSNLLYQSDGTGAGTKSLSNFDLDIPLVAFGDDAAAIRGKGIDYQRDVARIGQNAQVTVLHRSHRIESFWSPGGFVSHNGYLYFTIYTNEAREHNLWRSDGTPGGDELVTRLTDGSGFSLSGFSLGLRTLAEIDGRVFFTLADSRYLTRDQVWVTDGPNFEIFIDEPLESIEYFPGSFAYSAPTVWDFLSLGAGQHLFFKQMELSKTVQLWRTDGLEKELIREFIIPDNVAIRSSFVAPTPQSLIDGIVYFFVDDGEHGSELWRTDGTASGTMLVRDIALGAASLKTDPHEQFRVNNKMLFWADNGVSGFELYVVGEEPVIDFSALQTTLFEDGKPAFPVNDPVSLTRLVPSGTSIVDLVFTSLSASGSEMVDFVSEPQRITFLPGETEKSFYVPIVDDRLVEGIEQFQARIVPVDNAAADNSVLTVTILDNEPTEAPSGDANGDNTVNFVDFAILRSHFGKSTLLASFDGDFDDDRFVSFADFLILAANYGRPTTSQL